MVSYLMEKPFQSRTVGNSDEEDVRNLGDTIAKKET